MGTHRYPVPCVDGNYRHDDLCNLVVGEDPACFLINLLTQASLVN